LHYKIIRAPKKFKNWPRPLFKPITNHTCHQKPNPSRETVPLSFDYRVFNCNVICLSGIYFIMNMQKAFRLFFFLVLTFIFYYSRFKISVGKGAVTMVCYLLTLSSSCICFSLSLFIFFSFSSSWNIACGN
jgi:hypothetical protein